MTIIPNGKKRIMQAQALSNEQLPNPQLDQFNIQPNEQAPNIMPSQGNISLSPSETEKSFDTSKVNKDSEGSPDIQEFVFKFLEGKGYPPRRLSEFEEEFIEEKIYPGDIRDITVVLPDRYYGSKKRLSSEDLKSFIKDISDKFNLVFADGERKDKKCIMHFNTKQEVSQEEKDQQDSSGDSLEEIFGTPKTEKKKTEKKAAKTIRELIKESNENLLESLYKKGINNVR